MDTQADPVEADKGQPPRRRRLRTSALRRARARTRAVALSAVLALSGLTLSVVASPAQAWWGCGCIQGPDLERLVNEAWWHAAQEVNRALDQEVNPALYWTWDSVTKAVTETAGTGVTEGNAGTTTEFRFDVYRNGPRSGYEEFRVWTTALTAKSPDDYVHIDETVVLEPYEDKEVVTVTINGDDVEEPDEVFELNVHQYYPQSRTSSTKVTIRSDELPAGVVGRVRFNTWPWGVEARPWVAAFSVEDAVVREGDAGSATQAVLTVSRSRDFSPNHDVIVRVTTADGTAERSSDYVHLDEQVTFRPGETSKSVAVTVNGDDAHEDDEAFSVLLHNDNGSAGPPAGPPARVTIRDDDNVSGVAGPAGAVRPVLAPEGAPPSVVGPALSVSDAPDVAEGTPGSGHTDGFSRFTVSLSAPASTDVSVHYKTAGGNATGTATGAGGDYKIVDDSLVIPAGKTSGVVEVPVTMDSSIEPDEEFFLHLSEPVGAGLADSEGKATIIDDDRTSTATLSVDDVTVAEGNAGTTTQAIFTVKLSKPFAAPVTVRAFTADGTAHPLPHKSDDYVHLDQVLTFARDETTKQVAVTINGDNVDERDETFFLALEDSTGPLRDKRQGVGVIANDDGLTPMSIDDVSIDEGDAGTTEARFTISLAHPSYRPISVNYATINGTARSTDHGTFGPADYASVSGVANFAPGQTTHTVVVPVNGDILKEQDEQFVVQLSGNVNATAVKRVGTGTIRNDD